MPNEISYAEVYQGFIDEELEARSYTQWMTPNEDKIEFSGGKTVKVAQLSVSGLGNYDREAASRYPNGSVKLEWVPYEMEMDRAVRFELGRLDPNDSHFMTTTENVTREFTRTQLVPEQDLFRFSRIYNKLAASDKYKDSHIKKLAAGADIVAALSELNNKILDDTGDVTDLVCFISLTHEPAFRAASKNNHHAIVFDREVSINGVTYSRGMSYDGLPCVFVPSRRMQTTVKVNDGRTEGQTQGGIEVDAASKQIEFMLMSSEAPIACSRIDSLKIFSADENQTGDETTINYHLLYDLWVLENQVATLGAAVREG